MFCPIVAFVLYPLAGEQTQKSHSALYCRLKDSSDVPSSLSNSVVIEVSSSSKSLPPMRRISPAGVNQLTWSTLFLSRSWLFVNLLVSSSKLKHVFPTKSVDSVVGGSSCSSSSCVSLCLSALDFWIQIINTTVFDCRFNLTYKFVPPQITRSFLVSLLLVIVWPILLSSRSGSLQ